MIIKNILIFLLLAVVSVYGQRKKVEVYPQDFSPQALKNVRAEMADSAGMMVLSNINQLKAVTSTTKPVYLAGAQSGVFVYKPSTDNNLIEDSLTTYQTSDGNFRVREKYLLEDKKKIYSSWSGAVGDGSDESTEIRRIFKTMQPLPHYTEFWEQGERLTESGGAFDTWTGINGTVLNNVNGGTIDGDSLEFDGTDDYIGQSSNDDTYNPGRKSFTVSVKFKYIDPGASDRQCLVGKIRGLQSSGISSYPGWGLFYNVSGAMIFKIQSPNVSAEHIYYTPGSILTDGAIHVVTVSVDRATDLLWLYVDGQPVDPAGEDISLIDTSTIETDLYDLRLGETDQGDRDLTGTILAWAFDESNAWSAENAIDFYNYVNRDTSLNLQRPQELVLENKYYIPGMTIKLSSPIKITSNDSTAGFKGDNSLSYAGESGSSFWIEGDNIELEGFQMDSISIVLDETVRDLTIDNLKFKNWSVVGGERGAIFCDGDDNHGTEILQDISIKNCIFEKAENTGGAILRADKIKNASFENNIFRDIIDTTGTTHYLCGVRGTQADTGIFISNNKFYDITGKDRLWLVVAMGTSSIVTDNQFWNITHEAASFGLECIRGSSRSYIVSNNTFTNINVTGAIAPEGNCISMKGDGTDIENGNGIISTNFADDITGIHEFIVAHGNVLIKGNEMINNDIRIPVAIGGTGEAVGDTTFIIGNVFTSSLVGSSYLVPITPASAPAGPGIYKFKSNEWRLRGTGSGSGPGIFSSTGDITNVGQLILENETFHLDGLLFWGGSSGKAKDTVAIKIKDTEFNISGFDDASEVFFDVSIWNLTEFTLDNVTFNVDTSVTLYSLAEVYNGSKIKNCKFNIDGTLFSVFRTSLNVGGDVRIDQGTQIDATDAQSALDIFRCLSDHDSIYFNNIHVFPKSNITHLVNLVSGAAKDTLKYIQVTKSHIEATTFFRSDDVDDTLRTIDFYDNYVNYLNVLGGSGAIENFNHAGNTAAKVSITNGHRLYNSGVATLSGTSTAITHKIYGTPDSTKASITPLGSLGVSSIWVQDFTSTNFDILTDSTSTIKILWSLPE